MACPYGSERSFGLRVGPDCRPFDFTLQFEDLFLARSSRPSTVLSLYLPSSMLYSIARVPTLWLLVPGSPESIVMTVALALAATAALLGPIGIKAALRMDQISGAPETSSGVRSRTSFAWL
ncbi:Putative ABC transporter [Tolypocladium paradoxum]|uniref:ABC transporter n=1 Tax=Tolypocladium paradoxum TaxID=94208 RepID=A0A2S4KXN3_9HYPO|nr:Putative ABC transporter [Tolypocladium paradoxum]